VRTRPDGSALRIFLGVWYVVLGVSTTVLPPGPLSPEDPLVWLRGLVTVVCGLAVLWLAPVENRFVDVLGHLLVAAIQGWIAVVMIDQPGALTPSFTLLVVAIATASLPLYRLRRSRPLGGLPAFPMGVVAAAMAAVQGMATTTGADRSAIILTTAGISPQFYGVAMAVVGIAAVAVCWTGFGGRRVVAALTYPSAAFVLGVIALAGLEISSSYWILGAPGYVRVAALLLAPWSATFSIDWRGAFARTAVTVTSTAIGPLMLIVTLLLYGPGWAQGMGTTDRQLLFGLIVLLMLASVFGALFAARELTGSLEGLAQHLRRSSVDVLAQKRSSPITEVDVLRRAVVDLYDKILAQNAELQRANATKDEFLGLVSHELKTPITTILGTSALIRQRMGPGEEGIIDDLEAEADRLAGIVDNLLALARLDAGAISPAEPVLLNRIAQQETERAAKRDTTREYPFVADGEAVVEAVPEQISMVLRNFLTNAVKYSPNGSPISVHVSTAEGRAVLAVHDDGTALKAEEADKVFQPFYRSVWADRHTTGVGIGLAVCRRVAESLGGLVEVKLGADAAGGSGTEFRLELPLAASDIEVAAGPESAAEPAVASVNA
jgi:signal transduction histidine kinase